jgi:hypothetical protein
MTPGRNDRYFGLAAGKDEQSDSHLLRFCRTDSVRSSTRMRQNHKQNHLGRPDSVWGASSERREKVTWFRQVSRQPTRCSDSSTSMRYQPLWF